MVFLLLSLLIPTTAADISACPKVICGHERDQYCGGFPLQANELIVQPCHGENDICEMPSDPPGTNLNCKSFNGNEYDRWNPYYGVVGSEFGDYQWRGDEEVCDGEGSLCGREWFCGVEGRCERRKGENQDCIQGECQWGLTCNLQKCIPVGSLPPGSYAETQWACSRFTLTDQFLCADPPKSITKLPVLCQSDLDCVGSDGSNSECVCGMNTKGQRYCNLHRGDLPVQLYLSASSRLTITEMRWRFYEAVYYPLLQDNPTCLIEIFPIHYLYQVYKLAKGASLVWTGLGLFLLY